MTDEPGYVAHAPDEELEARVIAWTFGGGLQAGPIALALDGCRSAEVRMADPSDQELWNDQSGPPLRRDLLAHVAICCDLLRVATPEVAHEFGVRPEPGLHDAYRLLDLHDVVFRADQCIDLIKLLIPAPVGLAFSERRVRYRQGNYSLKHDVLSLNEFRAVSIGARWSLSAEQAATLPGLWRNATSGSNAQTLRFPLRRFGAAAQRGWHEDRLVDYWIGLEGLFKRDDEVGHIPQTIAPRVNRLIGGDESERLRESYRMRILISHGRVDYEDEALDRAIEIADDVLRRSLKVLVTADEPIDTLA